MHQTTKDSKLVTNVLWIIYIALLTVLLPHLQWAASQFEPMKSDIVSWSFAVAFELVIAAFTYKLQKRIENTPKHIKAKGKIAVIFYQWANPLSFGLLFFVFVSALGNLTHAYQFGSGKELRIFEMIPFGVFAVAFGGALPLANLLFAHVLSGTVDSEDSETAPNPELDAAKEQMKKLREELKQTNELRMKAELAFTKADQERIHTEANYRKMAQALEMSEADRIEAQKKLEKLDKGFDDFVRLFGESKRDRIVAAFKLWKELPANSIAIIAGSSPSHVSEVLKSLKDEPKQEPELQIQMEGGQA